MEIIAAEVGNVWRKRRKQCLDRGMVQALLQFDYQPTDGETNTDAARGDKKKLQACLCERKSADHHGGHCETERDKRSSVVYQAFSFEDHNDLARHPQILSYCQRCHGVGRRDDGTENKTYRQG